MASSTATATTVTSSSDFGDDDDDGVHGQRMKPLSTIEAFIRTRNAAHHLIDRKKNVLSSTASAHQVLLKVKCPKHESCQRRNPKISANP